MIRSMKTTTTVLAVCASLSCFPGRFDDLEKETWVQFVDRDNDTLNGDIGFDVAPMDLATGTAKGGVFIVASQGVGGVTQVTIDESGGVSGRVSAAGNANVQGGLVPLNNQDIFTVAPFAVSGQITGFVAGQPRNATVNATSMIFNGLAAKFQSGITGGIQVGPSGLQEFGNDILVGDFGSGLATPDIIVLGAASITVVTGASNYATSHTCRLLRPNFPTSFAMGFKNAALAPIKANGKNQLIVSGVDDDNLPKIFVFEGTDIVDSLTQCPTSTTMTVGTALEKPPIAIAVGDFDGTTGLDLVTGTSTDVPAGTPGKVQIYRNINFASPPTPVAIVPVMADQASPLYGSRLLIDDVDDGERAEAAGIERLAAGGRIEGGAIQRHQQAIVTAIDNDGTNELVVGDPSTSVNAVTGAGRIYVFSLGAQTCTDTRGTGICLEESLWAPEPGTDNHYGRAMATTTYKTAKGTKRILGVGERNKLNVYFRVNASAADPREL